MSYMEAQNEDEHFSRFYGGNMSNTRDIVSSRWYSPNTEKMRLTAEYFGEMFG